MSFGRVSPPKRTRNVATTIRRQLACCRRHYSCIESPLEHYLRHKLGGGQGIEPKVVESQSPVARGVPRKLPPMSLSGGGRE
eukprot:312775-Prorocentrum_minimum.AAC.5